MYLDWTILQWIQGSLRCGVLDCLMPVVSMLGNHGSLWICCAFVLLCTKRYRKHGILLLMGLAAGVLVGNLLLKPLVARPRPCWLDTSLPLLIPSPGDYSFPSGHTLSSVIAAVILTAADRRFGCAAIPSAAAIAFSRLYLYVHFPNDIVGGILLGLLIGLAVLSLGRRLREIPAIRPGCFTFHRNQPQKRSKCHDDSNGKPDKGIPQRLQGR